MRVARVSHESMANSRTQRRAKPNDRTDIGGSQTAHSHSRTGQVTKYTTPPPTPPLLYLDSAAVAQGRMVGLVRVEQGGGFISSKPDGSSSGFAAGPESDQEIRFRDHFVCPAKRGALLPAPVSRSQGAGYTQSRHGKWLLQAALAQGGTG